ncbi:MAG: FAD-dependent oxidoreductase [Phaeodactylibacter sp.]|uniref:FAD-dependent oxidoreductase n=1 Tax=Phaeodactylibacter sp. TaxID=1940289 RepID=UPI0032EBE2B4
MTRLIVVGAGISGLTTAVRLQEAGFDVSIYARELPQDTTSAVAAAIWFPYAVKPVQAANRWSAESYLAFEQLSQQPGTGVSMTDFLVLTRPGLDNSWREELPEGAVRLARPEELPAGYEMGYLARVPLAETQQYLPYLLERFRESGGSLQQKAVTDLRQLFQEADGVVNCAGLGASLLCQDETLYPIRGQVVKVQKQPGARSMVDSMDKGKLAYIIERSDSIILGGTDYDHDYNTSPTPEDTRVILDRCAQLQPALSQPAVIAAAAGLRPKRPSIRCEREPDQPVVHNYGHGGAGFTVSWGCAEEVVRIIRRVFIRLDARG